jgi:hypothetical protein
MALPVLLTVGALGVGFVALSRKRAEMPAANGTAAPTGAIEPAVDNGVAAAAESPGETVIGDGAIGGTVGGTLVTDETPAASAYATGQMEQNKSTGGADPATQPTVLASADGVAASSPEAVPTGSYTMNTTQLYFGTINGVTKQQEAVALAEMGPIMNMVW